MPNFRAWRHLQNNTISNQLLNAKFHFRENSSNQWQLCIFEGPAISIPHWILILGAGENYQSIVIYFPCFVHKIQLIINWEADLRRIELVARELLNAEFQGGETFAK